MDEHNTAGSTSWKKELAPETFVFPIVFAALLGYFAIKMGPANAINTMMNTAYRLLIDTVLYITAVCVIMGAVSALLSEFGFVSLVNRLLQPLMKPIFGLPGAAALGVVTTFLSDNPAILALAEDRYFRHYFKNYQFPALTNLGTSFGMGLIVCTYMYSLSPVMGTSLGSAVFIGLLGAVIGSVVSTRIMLIFTRRYYGREAELSAGRHLTAEDGNPEPAEPETPQGMRPIRDGGIGSRAMAAILEGGHNGVKMGISIVPGVLVICTLVMMLICGPGEGGVYTGSAYEGIRLLPTLAGKIDFILKPLFGFSSPEAIGIPVTALGAAGAALSMTASLIRANLVQAGDIAVFTAMCMCWSGYLSTHASMMDSLNCKKLIGKAIVSHTIGGLAAGAAAHWLFVLFHAIF